VSKLEGVDMDTPPNSKIFDCNNSTNTTDIALLARRRAQASTQAQIPPINITFSGLADALRGMPSAPAPAIQPGPAQPPRKKLPPQMELHAFCTKYSLHDALEWKLKAVDVSGPHVLRLIGDAALVDKARLSIGELATLHDTEERWTAAAEAVQDDMA
ncbi:hypothetical protein DFP72DRAFT_831627, partial [Ephemerocybe angulata]